MLHAPPSSTTSTSECVTASFFSVAGETRTTERNEKNQTRVMYDARRVAYMGSAVYVHERSAWVSVVRVRDAYGSLLPCTQACSKIPLASRIASHLASISRALRRKEKKRGSPRGSSLQLVVELRVVEIILRNVRRVRVRSIPAVRVRRVRVAVRVAPTPLPPAPGSQKPRLEPRAFVRASSGIAARRRGVVRGVVRDAAAFSSSFVSSSASAFSASAFSRAHDSTARPARLSPVSSPCRSARLTTFAPPHRAIARARHAPSRARPSTR